MNKFINIVLLIILLIMSIMNCVLATKLADKTEELIELTNVEPELVFVDSLIYDTFYLNYFDTVRLTKCQVDTITLNDTILVIDSVDVVIPIELKHYHDTLSSRCWCF